MTKYLVQLVLFLGVPVLYQPFCILLCCQGKLGELLEKVCTISVYNVFCHVVFSNLYVISKKIIEYA